MLDVAEAQRCGVLADLFAELILNGLPQYLLPHKLGNESSHGDQRQWIVLD